MENPEEVLAFLEEFTKLNTSHIPRELEEYLCFVAKTGDPVYQWSAIKTLFRQKLINVITEFYETCPSVEIPPCPNVDLFNYDRMKNFILEKLDTFAAAPFTVQRICELLTTPRKEYNRIDKYMRALEKNILVVSTREPGNRRATENGEGIVNGIESEHTAQEISNSEINVEVDMEESPSPSWPNKTDTSIIYTQPNLIVDPQSSSMMEPIQQQPFAPELNKPESTSSAGDSVITCQKPEEPYVSIEPVIVLPSQNINPAPIRESEIIVTITPDPIQVKVKPPEMDIPVSAPEEATSSETASTTSDEANSPPSVINENDQELGNVLDSTTTITPTTQIEDSPEISSSSSSSPSSNMEEASAVTSEAETQDTDISATEETPSSSENTSVVAPVWHTAVSDSKPPPPETSDVEPETSEETLSPTDSAAKLELETETDAAISSSDEVAVSASEPNDDTTESEPLARVCPESGEEEKDVPAEVVPVENEVQTETQAENEAQTDYPVAESEHKAEEPSASEPEAPIAMEVDELLPDTPDTTPQVSASE